MYLGLKLLRVERLQLAQLYTHIYTAIDLSIYLYYLYSIYTLYTFTIYILYTLYIHLGLELLGVERLQLLSAQLRQQPHIQIHTYLLSRVKPDTQTHIQINKDVLSIHDVLSRV